MLTVTDIDGNIYETVRIGDLYWTTSNLKTTRFNNGTPIKKISCHDQINEFRNASGSVHLPISFCCYDFCEENAKEHGFLYSFLTLLFSNTKYEFDWSIYEFNITESLLTPPGWHIPTLKNWASLYKSLNDQLFPNSFDINTYNVHPEIQNIMKSKNLWDPHLVGNNLSGLSIAASGCLSYEGAFLDLGRCAQVWLGTQTGADQDHKNLIRLGHSSSHVVPEMASVRLVRKAE